MEPLSLVFSAVVAGAAAVLKPTAEQAVKDAYVALRTLIGTRWRGVGLDAIERNPAAPERQKILKEDLEAVGEPGDREVLAQAQALLRAIRAHDPAAAAAAGISVRDLDIAGTVNLEDLTADGAIVAQGIKAGGDFNLRGARAGNGAGAATAEAPPAAPRQGPLGLSMQGLEIGGNADIAIGNTHVYMLGRGKLYRDLLDGPCGTIDSGIRGRESVQDLRVKLIHGERRLDKVLPITVTGTLFPCALLSSGWWENAKSAVLTNIDWRDEIQAWLFQGFDQWGPSWDFTWDFDNWTTSGDRPYYIAQLGDGDEANSLPVLIPGDKARRLQEMLDRPGEWGGIEAGVTGLLGHRDHFRQHFEPGVLEHLGGLLDYCLWIDPGDASHCIQPMIERTGMYSGYLWRCVAPEDAVKSGVPSLRDVYFIWEHTNFASRAAVDYNIDSLLRKEEYLAKRLGTKFVLVQKSSSLVPGEPNWTSREIYDVLLGRSGPRI